MSKIIGVDVDGVLLKWEEAFDDFMAGQGLTKKDQGHFDLRKHYPEVPAEALNTYISVFNESAYMRYLEPMDGAVEYVTKLADEGYKFSVITSQTLNKVANRAREDNLKEVFGDVFEEKTDMHIQMNIQRANSWKDIYDIIKEKTNVTNT